MVNVHGARRTRLATSKATVRALVAGMLITATSVVTGGIGASTAAAATPSTAGTAPPTFVTLRPGQHETLTAPVRVNVIFVGYPSTSVNVNRIMGAAPSSANPQVRYPAFYGIAQPVGIQYQYHYSVRFADSAFDDQFFGYLAHAGTVRGPDAYQRFYNHQVHRSLTVGRHVRYIDAPTTEHWLESHADSSFGLSPNDYTVFLIDWYARPDFQFHLYTRTGAPDPDTGVDGGLADNAHLDAWGGSTGRSFFYDMSAGPVLWDDSYDVDDADLYGNGTTAYRMPPIWEYGNTSGYRPFTDLSGDLGKVLRFVVLDELFSASPIFDPAASVPGPGGTKRIVLDLFEGDPTHNGLDDIKPSVIQQAHQSLEPYYPMSVTVHDAPFTGGIRRAFQIANGTLNANGCWNQYGDPFAELYCYLAANRARYFPAAGNDSIIPAVGFTIPNDETGALAFTGDTDDDWRTGTPSFIYMMDIPYFRSAQSQLAYAYTHLLTHEAGHFVGLSHTHDGYDPNSGVDFTPGGAYDFAWIGDESASSMSYLEPYEVFDVFNRDNLARWEAGRLLDLANSNAPAILATHNARAIAYLGLADAEFTAGKAAMSQGGWMAAATSAVQGYTTVQRAAMAAGITLAVPAMPPSAAPDDSPLLAIRHANGPAITLPRTANVG